MRPPTRQTVEDAGLDGEADAPEEVGPTSCAIPCATSCDSDEPEDGDCTACIETVCGEYAERAEQAPGRDELYTCLSGCGSDTSCPNDCCDQHPQACAWEMTYQMCTCGFPEDNCDQACAQYDCSTTGLTQSCGVCTTQSPCSLATFDYLFAPERTAHQDCVDTCMSSAMSHEQCLDLCRDDYPEAAALYDVHLACVCGG